MPACAPSCMPTKQRDELQATEADGPLGEPPNPQLEAPNDPAPAQQQGGPAAVDEPPAGEPEALPPNALLPSASDAAHMLLAGHHRSTAESWQQREEGGGVGSNAAGASVRSQASSGALTDLKGAATAVFLTCSSTTPISSSTSAPRVCAEPNFSGGGGSWAHGCWAALEACVHGHSATRLTGGSHPLLGAVRACGWRALAPPATHGARGRRLRALPFGGGPRGQRGQQRSLRAGARAERAAVAQGGRQQQGQHPERQRRVDAAQRQQCRRRRGGRRRCRHGRGWRRGGCGGRPRC
jgi:hypothetical protein